MGNQHNQTSSKPSTQTSNASSKPSAFGKDIQTLCNLGQLPAMYVARTWKVYLHKRRAGIPHQRLILEESESGAYILCVELTNTESTGYSGALIGADWKIHATIIDEAADRTRDEWRFHGTSNFAMQHLVQHVDHVSSGFGDYNVFTKNCQTFAVNVANELGNIQVRQMNDGTKAMIGSAATASAVVLASGFAIFNAGKAQKPKSADDDEDK